MNTAVERSSSTAGSNRAGSSQPFERLKPERTGRIEYKTNVKT